MKKWIYVVAPVLMMLLFTRCKNDGVTPDETLIAEIENAQNKVNVDPTALPETAQQTIQDEYFDTYIESCAQVPGKGYEVLLGNEDQIYFRENGLELRDGQGFGPHRPGPCGRGIPVDVADLPDEITTYVAENYPDAEILRAKHFPRGYVLLISGRRLLLFNTDNEFVAERVFYFCDLVGHPIDPGNLPAAVTTYINDNYPDADLVRAFLVRGRIVVGLMTPDGRKILVFDMDGNFLFERG